MEKIFLDKLVGKAVEVEFEHFTTTGVVYGYGIQDGSVVLVVVRDSDGRIYSSILPESVRVLYCGVGA